MTDTNSGWWRTTVETIVPEGHSRKPEVLWSVDWGMTKGHQFRRPTKNMIIDMLEDIDMSTWPENWVIMVSRVELRPEARYVRSYRKPACFDTPKFKIGDRVAYVADYDKVHEECPRGTIVAEDDRRTMSDYQMPGPPLPLHNCMSAPAWLVLWDYPFREQTGPDNPTGADWIWKHDKDLVAE